MNLILVEGQEALLGTAPVVGVGLGLGQPGKDLLGLQFSSHRAIIGFADEIPRNDLGVSMVNILIHNEPCIVSLKTFLHHAKHLEHLILIKLDVDRHEIDIDHVVQAVRPSHSGKILLESKPIHFILESSIVGF